MTTPPPSETGPSAEEQARWKAADDLVWQWEKLRGSIIGGTRYSATRGKLVDLVAGALLAAKRSAHLEDARAGCDWCARTAHVGAPEKRDGWKGWWHPGKAAGSQHNFFKCERPEVWDALYLLSGGQK